MKKKWQAEWGAYTFTIEEKEDRVDLDIEHWANNDKGLWFNSYKSARGYLRREYAFNGRMRRLT